MGKNAEALVVDSNHRNTNWKTSTMNHSVELAKGEKLSTTKNTVPISELKSERVYSASVVIDNLIYVIGKIYPFE